MDNNPTWKKGEFYSTKSGQKVLITSVEKDKIYGFLCPDQYRKYHIFWEWNLDGTSFFKAQYTLDLVEKEAN